MAVVRETAPSPVAPDYAHLETALQLTAIALLLSPMGPWFVRPAVLGAAALCLISPRVLRMPAIWVGLALAIALRIAEDWPLADNHIYLLVYWSLAIGVALRSVDPPTTLAWLSRRLLGLAFLFACLWKVILSPDFLDGRFFRVTLLTDPRFGEAAMLIGGLSADQLDANRHALAPLPDGAELLNPPAVVEPARLRAFATASTWGVLALEALVAAAMFLPASRAAAIVRHTALLLFCAITYAFAPVAGFGWALLVMGLAQVESGRVWLGRAYVVAFLMVLFYTEVPWADLVLDMLR
jgi:hypothetical protein